MQPLQNPPGWRIGRSFLWILLGLVAALPGLLAVLDSFGIEVDGPAIVALGGLCVVVVTTIVNTVEKAGSAPVIRTVLQVIIAVATVLGVGLVAALDGTSLHVDPAQLAAITGAVIFAATLIQNLLERAGVIATFVPGERAARRENAIVAKTLARVASGEIPPEMYGGEPEGGG